VESIRDTLQKILAYRHIASPCEIQHVFSEVAIPPEYTEQALDSTEKAPQRSRFRLPGSGPHTHTHTLVLHVLCFRTCMVSLFSYMISALVRLCALRDHSVMLCRVVRYVLKGSMTGFASIWFRVSTSTALEKHTLSDRGGIKYAGLVGHRQLHTRVLAFELSNL
jgi:hypothetical protein